MSSDIKKYINVDLKRHLGYPETYELITFQNNDSIILENTGLDLLTAADKPTLISRLRQDLKLMMNLSNTLNYKIYILNDYMILLYKGLDSYFEIYQLFKVLLDQNKIHLFNILWVDHHKKFSGDDITRIKSHYNFPKRLEINVSLDSFNRFKSLIETSAEDEFKTLWKTYGPVLTDDQIFKLFNLAVMSDSPNLSMIAVLARTDAVRDGLNLRFWNL